MNTAKKAPVGQAAIPSQTSQASAAGSPIAYSADRLANQFLIAMPGMVDPNFAGSVIYLFEHTERGAMGLVINRPTELDMGALFEKIEVKLEAEPVSEQPVYFGGPVQIERGFVLHEPMLEADSDEKTNSIYASTLSVPGGLAMTTSKDVLEAMANGSGPQRVLVTLGYASWGEGQLESEIGENSWLTVAADPVVIFDTPIEQRYDKALSLLGLQSWMLSTQVGHA